jgi:ferritin-like metal-binding protein YciE
LLEECEQAVGPSRSRNLDNGALLTWAEELGLDRAVQLLEESLKEQKATAQALTKLAEASTWKRKGIDEER